MQKLRHVKLARQAMVFWQSYDAFARICMSIGVNQLLNAASYFILAYYMSEVKVPSSATYGVLVACSCCFADSFEPLAAPCVNSRCCRADNYGRNFESTGHVSDMVAASPHAAVLVSGTCNCNAGWMGIRHWPHLGHAFYSVLARLCIQMKRLRGLSRVVQTNFSGRDTKFYRISCLLRRVRCDLGVRSKPLFQLYNV